MRNVFVIFGSFYFLEAQDCKACDYEAQTNEVMEFQVRVKPERGLDWNPSSESVHEMGGLNSNFDRLSKWTGYPRLNVIYVKGNKVNDWIDADVQIWTSFLKPQPGFISKGDYFPQDCDLTSSKLCLVM